MTESRLPSWLRRLLRLDRYRPARSRMALLRAFAAKNTGEMMRPKGKP